MGQQRQWTIWGVQFLVVIPRLLERGFSLVPVRSVVDGVFNLLSGRAALYVGGGEKIWDVGGPRALVHAAGGVSRLTSGEAPTWNNLVAHTFFARSELRMRELLEIAGVSKP